MASLVFARSLWRLRRCCGKKPCALLRNTAMPRPAALLLALAGLMGAAGVVLALGTCLFSADLALRALADTKLFALAAPAGGMLMILAWLGIAAAGLIAAARR